MRLGYRDNLLQCFLLHFEGLSDAISRQEVFSDIFRACFDVGAFSKLDWTLGVVAWLLFEESITELYNLSEHLTGHGIEYL